MKKISLILLLCIILFSGCTHKNHMKSDVYPSDNLILDKSTEENEQASNMSTYEFEMQELFAKRDDKQIYGVILYSAKCGRENANRNLFSWLWRELSGGSRVCRSSRKKRLCSILF